MRGRLIALATATALTVSGIMWDGLPANQHIARSEGKVNLAYADVAYGWAVTTICYGHTRTARRGQWRSDEQCLDLLDTDIAAALNDMRRLLGPVMMTEGELVGTVSFVFNVGPTKLRSSTWRRKFLAGDRRGACLEMLRWRYSNGKVWPGLETRRKGESAVCLRDL